MATKKEMFIKWCNEAKEKLPMSEDVKVYFNALQEVPDKDTKKFTENGLIILRFIKENKDTYNNLFTARGIADGLEINSKKVSGAARKLVTDGYLEKVGENPTCYILTSLGEDIDLSAE